MTLTRLNELETVIASLPLEKQAEILAQAMITARLTHEVIREERKTTAAKTTSELYQEWVDSKTSSTARAYRNDVEHFANWLVERGYPTEAYEWKRPHCNEYLKHLLDLESKGAVTRATVRRRLASLKSFLRYAQESGFSVSNPCIHLKVPEKRDTVQARILSEAQIHLLINAAKNGTTVEALRDYWLLKLLYLGGFRVGEVAGLTWGQITQTSQGNYKIRVIGKRDKERFVVIPARHIQQIQALREGNHPTEPVFKSREGGVALCDRSIRRIVEKYARKAGLSPLPSCHWLRHSHATHALQRDASVKVATKTLGHASASTLLDNYVHIGDEESSAFYLNLENL